VLLKKTNPNILIWKYINTKKVTDLKSSERGANHVGLAASGRKRGLRLQHLAEEWAFR
jgi:hypothetical protein